MGMCCCGSSGEPSDPGSCSEIGCDYFDDSSSSCIEGCAFLSLLADYLATESNNDSVIQLAAGGTFTALYDLRDELLVRSSLGRQLLDYYREYAQRGLDIVSSEPDLLRETLRVFLVGASFGRAVLREHDGRSIEAIGERRFTGDAYESGVALLARFRDMAPDGEFDEPIDFLEREIGRFVGLTPREALDALMEGA